MSESKGQELLTKLETWIASYVHAKPATHLVIALWCLHTWFTERLEATPLLTITWAPGTGKTRIGEIVKGLSRAGRLIVDITPAAYFRLMTQVDGRMTSIMDESERMQSGAATLRRAVANAGYRQGGTVPRTMPNGMVVDFGCYAPMVCIAVGEPAPTLRSRSIIIETEAGTPTRKWMHLEAEAAMHGLVTEINQPGVWKGLPRSRYVDHLEEREQEIWSGIYGVADALGVSKATYGRIDAVSADNQIRKQTTAARRYEAVEAANGDKSEDRRWRERAIADIKTVVDGLTAKGIHTDDLIAKLKAIDTAPWRMFKGVGLDALSLSALVSPYGLQPSPIMLKGKQLRGYKLADIKRINLDKLKASEPEGAIVPHVDEGV